MPAHDPDGKAGPSGLDPHGGHVDNDFEAEDEQAEKELSRFLEDIRAAKNCVRCFNFALLALGVGLTVFAFVGGEFLLSLNWLAYALSGIGIGIVFTTLLGLVGACFDVFRGVLILVSRLRGSGRAQSARRGRFFDAARHAPLYLPRVPLSCADPL